MTKTLSLALALLLLSGCGEEGNTRPTCAPDEAYTGGACVKTLFTLGEVVVVDASETAALASGYYALAVLATDTESSAAIAFPVTIEGHIGDPPATSSTSALLAAPLPRLCATPRLAARARDSARPRPRVLRAVRLAPAYEVGDRRVFYVPDLSSFENIPHEAELRVSGTHVNVWEDVSQNPAGTLLTSDLLAELMFRLDEGVLPRDIAIFGAFSDVDGNGKLDVFFTELLTEPEIAAFVWEDTLLGPVADTDYGEVIYATVETDAAATASLLAHELQHLITIGRRLAQNPGGTSAELGLTRGIYALEGMAELAVHWAGQPGARLASVALQYPREFSLARLWQSDYETDSVRNIVHYGIAALMTEYAFDQAGAVAIEGPGLVRDLGGIAVSQALTDGTYELRSPEATSGRSFASFYVDFAVALLLTSVPGELSAREVAAYRFAPATPDAYFDGHNGPVFEWSLQESLDASRSGALLSRMPWSQRGTIMTSGGLGFYSLAVGVNGAALSVLHPSVKVAVLRHAQL